MSENKRKIVSIEKITNRLFIVPTIELYHFPGIKCYGFKIVWLNRTLNIEISNPERW